MRLIDIDKRVRNMTRDFTSSIFREIDIIDFANEGIDRMMQLVPAFSNMEYLVNSDDVPLYVPKQFHHLIAVYSASRVCAQDERTYQAMTYMNEFETKLEELKTKIENGEIVITDPETGEPVAVGAPNDYVVNNYFFNLNNASGDVDNGVDD